jgi:hypothetical protein
MSGSPMIIPITDNYRLESDSRQWIVKQRKIRRSGTDAGSEHWDILGYCVSLEHAVNLLCDRRIKASTAETLIDALADVKNVVTDLTQALSPEFQVKRV